jgi:hypothetical protein
MLMLQFSYSCSIPWKISSVFKETDLYVLFFQEHEETSMEGVQICGVNNSSPPNDREDNKHPLKFGESVVSVNVLKFPNL